MFRKIEDFETSWDWLTKGTTKILNALTNESLSKSVADDHRTLGRIAWHLVVTLPEMMKHTGLEISSIKEDDPIPSTVEAISKAYTMASSAVLDQVKSKWDDAALDTENEMYGEKWKKGVTLKVLIEHEIHHRGQMTVLMRQAGLKVPGMYGPSKEEWTTYGMQEPPI